MDNRFPNNLSALISEPNLISLIDYKCLVHKLKSGKSERKHVGLQNSSVQTVPAQSDLYLNTGCGILNKSNYL